MIGYLTAIKKGAELIIDTDDDNYPFSKESFTFPSARGHFQTTKADEGFVNVYRYFTDENIWPRGLPLNLILKQDLPGLQLGDSEIGIWQSLADGDSDVDAIYRLTSDKHVNFQSRDPIVLGKGTFAPFNSQSTQFTKKPFHFCIFQPLYHFDLLTF